MTNIVAIAVEKIQRYIFQRIDQSQNDDKTLRATILASNNISNSILEKIEEKFGTINKENKILWISGKVIFSSNLAVSEIEKKLKLLYQDIYINFQGNIFINYTVFTENNINDKIEVIKKANQNLADSETKTKIISKNQEILFQFQETKESELRNIEMDNEDTFISDMDDLVILDEKHESSSTDGKIAIVKADINNLGKIMKNLENYSNFDEISKLLEDKISIANFASLIPKYKLEKKILPFYVVGDDIFYATRINCVFDSIKVLNEMVNDINKNIQELKIENFKTELNIAVGVVFVNNHQPIRYYREMVEVELSQAKKTMKNEKSYNSHVGISMAGNSFHIFKKNLGKGESDGFFKFQTEIEELKAMMKNQIFSRTALHNLLINLENIKDPDKRMQYILYFCKPNLYSWKEINHDIYFKYYLLSHLVEDKKEDERKKERFFDPEKIEKILIPKIKLILLFLKEEYSAQSENNEINYKYIISSNKADQEKRIKSVLFHKPINYILEMTKRANEESIEGLFIKKFINKKNHEKKMIYMSARFEPSIFFRAKNLIELGKKEQVITMFKNYNSSFNKKTTEKKDTSRINEETKKEQNIHVLPFEEKLFEEKFKKIPARDVKWLDNLILLYQYNQQRIKLKTLIK